MPRSKTYSYDIVLEHAIQNFLSSIIPVTSRVCLSIVCLFIFFSCAKKEPETLRILTAGAAGDNTLVLEYLISQGVRNAIVAGIVDPEAVRYCDEVGVGNEVSITIGGKIDTVFGKSLEIRGIVKIVSSYDSLTRRKPAVVELDGIDLVLLTDRRSFISPQDFE